jgi:uncharacterized protein
MIFQRIGERLCVRLESGDPLVESLTRLLAAESIGAAAVSGLGAVRKVRVAFLDVDKKEYEAHEIEEQMELVSLVGNAALRDDTPFLHLHATLGRRDLSLFGGHLQEAVAHPTVEVWLAPEKEAIRRSFDENIGMAVMDLPERFSG